VFCDDDCVYFMFELPKVRMAVIQAQGVLPWNAAVRKLGTAQHSLCVLNDDCMIPWRWMPRGMEMAFCAICFALEILLGFSY